MNVRIPVQNGANMFDPIEEQVVAARGSATLSAQAVATTVLGFGFFVILVRLLGPFALGLYVAIGILTALGSALGGFGLPAAAVRFAAFLGFGGGEAAFRRTLLLLALCAAFITGIILYFLAPWTSAILAHSGAFTDLFRLAALLVTASILAGILDGWTRGQREFVRLAISRVVCRILSVGLGAYLLLTGWGVLGAIWSLITYHGLLIALLVPPFARGLLGREFYPLRGVVTFSLPLMASSAAVFGSGYAESLLIVAFLATPDLGVYNVALTVGTFLAIIMVGPLTTTVLPTSSRVAFLGRSQGGVFAVASRYVTLLVLPSSVGVVVLARQWVALVAGTDFAAATEPAALVGVMILPVALISI
ncbi:MAG: oligosaccharide flippase family protein, partial [Candidatus Binatia bacterium]